MWEKERDAAVCAACEAGGLLLSFYHDAVEVRSKGHDNPVTEADLAADAALKQSLRGAFPGYGWLSEETADSDERLGCDCVWIVDPLDGTKEFIEGVPQFSVSIGLVSDGVPVLGVVFNPAADELFVGIVGQGATLNGRAVSVSDRAELAGSKTLASRSELKRGEFGPFENDLEIEPVGSIAYKLALVAAGCGESSFSLGPKHEWDVCGGAALVLAAGGEASARDGSALKFNQKPTLTNGIMVTNGRIHQTLVTRCAPLLEQYAHRFRERDGA